MEYGFVVEILCSEDTAAYTNTPLADREPIVKKRVYTPLGHFHLKAMEPPLNIK
jgi:hypothetical protein